MDFLEDIFRVDCYRNVATPPDRVVEELNELLRYEDLPYHVTDLVETTVKRDGQSFIEITYPTVILLENDVVHVRATEPALRLLQSAEFKNANSEYLGALEEFRKGEFGDSLTKCASSFESVLKVLCEDNGWPYREDDSVKKLVKTVLQNTGLESYFEPMLMIVATLRNRMSTSHGAGVTPREPPPHFVRYALNATAAAILLVVETADS